MKKITILLISFSFIFGMNINLHNFFNSNKCSQILNNDGFFKTCYDYKLKGAKFVHYTLLGDLVNQINIKKRDRFYPDLNIPKRYRSYPGDYTHSGYDRGHMANDADFDYSHRSLHATYVMSNIVPQKPSVNREKHNWAGMERYERYVATKLHSADVLNIIFYTNHPKRIGYHQIAVPYAFGKIKYNKMYNFEKCFYIENRRQKAKTIKKYVIDCSKLLRKTR